MSNDADRPKKPLKERLEDFAQEILDTLGSLVAPEPALVPVPVRSPRPRPYRR